MDTFIFIAGAAVIYAAYQAVVDPKGTCGDIVRWFLKSDQPQAVIPVAALPEAPKPRARRTRKAAA
jgi:hypothetical protein